MLEELKDETVSRKTQYLLLSGMPLFFIIAGFFLQPINTIIPGIWTLMIEPDFLITDYFVVGGIGSAFINVGLLISWGWKWRGIPSPLPTSCLDLPFLAKT